MMSVWFVTICPSSFLTQWIFCSLIWVTEKVLLINCAKFSPLRSVARGPESGIYRIRLFFASLIEIWISLIWALVQHPPEPYLLQPRHRPRSLPASGTRGEVAGEERRAYVTPLAALIMNWALGPYRSKISIWHFCEYDFWSFYIKIYFESKFRSCILIFG